MVRVILCKFLNAGWMKMLKIRFIECHDVLFWSRFKSWSMIKIDE